MIVSHVKFECAYFFNLTNSNFLNKFYSLTLFFLENITIENETDEKEIIMDLDHGSRDKMAKSSRVKSEKKGKKKPKDKSKHKKVKGSSYFI